MGKKESLGEKNNVLGMTNIRKKQETFTLRIEKVTKILFYAVKPPVGAADQKGGTLRKKRKKDFP